MKTPKTNKIKVTMTQLEVTSLVMYLAEVHIYSGLASIYEKLKLARDKALKGAFDIEV